MAEIATEDESNDDVVYQLADAALEWVESMQEGYEVIFKDVHALQHQVEELQGGKPDATAQ